MSLTKEDLKAISDIVDTKLKKELAPIKTSIEFLEHGVNAIDKKLKFIQEDISGLRAEIIQIKQVVHIA